MSWLDGNDTQWLRAWDSQFCERCGRAGGGSSGHVCGVLPQSPAASDDVRADAYIKGHRDGQREERKRINRGICELPVLGGGVELLEVLRVLRGREDS